MTEARLQMEVWRMNKESQSIDGTEGPLKPNKMSTGLMSRRWTPCVPRPQTRQEHQPSLLRETLFRYRTAPLTPFHSRNPQPKSKRPTKLPSFAPKAADRVLYPRVVAAKFNQLDVSILSLQ